MVPEIELVATTNKEVAAMISELCEGNSNKSTGVRIKPPPAPTNDPKVLTEIPIRKNCKNSSMTQPKSIICNIRQNNHTTIELNLCGCNSFFICLLNMVCIMSVYCF